VVHRRAGRLRPGVSRRAGHDLRGLPREAAAWFAELGVRIERHEQTASRTFQGLAEIGAPTADAAHLARRQRHVRAVRSDDAP
jgi:hypothetical protein